jgi:uncharacterized membrane protein YdjX (TVP38/TMEM64 family)
MECGVTDKPVTQRRQTGRWVLLGLYVSVLVGLAVAWHQPAFRPWMEPQVLSDFGRRLLAMPAGFLVVMLGYVLLVMAGMPVLVLITVGTLVFTPWPGMAYALVGMVVGAVVTYAIGRYTGAQTMDRWTQGRLALVARHLQRRGLITVIAVRVMPVAPFIVVNMAAGALRVGLRDYVLGTFLGLLPGTIMISLFMGQVSAAWQAPSAGKIAALVGAVVAIAAVGWGVKRAMSRRAR